MLKEYGGGEEAPVNEKRRSHLEMEYSLLKYDKKSGPSSPTIVPQKTRKPMNKVYEVLSHNKTGKCVLF